MIPHSLPIFTPPILCPIFLFLCILYVSIHFMCVRVRGGLDGGGSSWVALWCVAGTGEPVFAVCFVPAQSVANYYQPVQYLPSHIPSNTLVKKRPSCLGWLKNSQATHQNYKCVHFSSHLYLFHLLCTWITRHNLFGSDASISSDNEQISKRKLSKYQREISLRQLQSCVHQMRKFKSTQTGKT